MRRGRPVPGVLAESDMYDVGRDRRADSVTRSRLVCTLSTRMAYPPWDSTTTYTSYY